MINLTDPAEIKRLAAAHGFRFSKSLGQNFLTDPSVVRKTASASAENGVKNVIEIGPGFGVLTRELAACYDRVVAVEIDKTLLPVLDETLAGLPNVTVVNADVMKTDLQKLIKSAFGGGKTNIAANLPYYITTPVVTSLLESGADIASITVMVQKEVAERLTAAPGSPECGAISAAVSYRANAKKLFDVPPSSFVPRPKVTSSVIRLDMLSAPAVPAQDEKLLFAVIKAAFGQRRKQLKNSLFSAFPNVGKQAISDAVDGAGLRPDIRGEKLTLEEFALVADRLYKHLK